MITEKHLQKATNQVDKAIYALRYSPEILEKVGRELFRIKRSLNNIKDFIEKVKK